MSDFLNDLNPIYGGKSDKIPVFKVNQIIRVSPSVFGIRGSDSSVSALIVEVFANGNLSVKALDSDIITVVYPSQIRN